MKKNTRIIISVAIAVAMLAATVIPAIFGGILSITGQAASSSAQLQQNQSEQSKLKDQLNDTIEKKNSVMNEKKKYDDEISGLADEMDKLSNQISSKERDIAAKESEISDLQKDIKKSNELLKERMRVMYEKGNASYVELLFSAKDLSDLFTKIEALKQIVTHDQSLINKLADEKQQIADAKESIELEKSELVSMKSDLAVQKQNVQAKVDKSNSLIKDLQSDEASIKAQIKEIEKENNEILAQIKQAQAAAQKQQVSSGGTSGGNSAPYTGGKLGWPCSVRGTITSTFGWRFFRGVQNYHTGIDIASSTGTPILAAESGTVIGSGWRNSYGNCITINHGNLTTLYAHCSVLQVSVGQKVSKGQQIALMGSTGNSTGPHLHFGVITSSGQYTDPAAYIY